MNLLGIDYGQKRIGLAWVQESLGVVLPFGQIVNKELGKTNEELINIIRTEKIDKLIIGLPLSEEGEENLNTERVRKFAQEIHEVTSLPFEFVDERFTTHEAMSMEGEASLDEKSAMLILQSFIEREK